MSTPLARLLARPRRRVAGIMSGTSTDGVDVAIVTLEGRGTDLTCSVEAFRTVPYTDTLRQHLLAQTTPDTSSVDALARLHFLLGEVMADAVLHTCRAAGLDPESLDLIGSHGHTVYHQPDPVTLEGHSVRTTLQIGSPAVIATRTGIPTVGDFRSGDVAAGGQGAPLVPYFDYVYFHHPKETRLLVNIGGIANLTVIPSGEGLEGVMAFDTGPGNMVIDALTRRLYGEPYDAGGNHAARGHIVLHLLANLLQHPFFHLPPPRTTGREMFGEAFVETLLRQGQDSRPEDLLATATALTAHTIYRAYRDFVAPEHPADVVIVSGGGIHNTFLMGLLADLFAPIPVRPVDAYGIAADAKEAICFAVLAHEFLNGVPTNVPQATGARHPALLGTLALPPSFART